MKASVFNNFKLSTVLWLYIITFVAAITVLTFNSQLGRIVGESRAEVGNGSVETLAKFTSNDVIEIPIISFKWGGSAPVDMTSGLASGKLQYEPVTLTHRVDQYTPAIFKKFTDHRQINSLEISVKSTDGQTAGNFVKYTFGGGGVISSVKYNVTGDSYPLEEMELKFIGNVNPKGGALGGAGGGQPTIEFNPGKQ